MGANSVASDLVLTRDGPVAVPLSYVVPQQGELLPLTVRATLDGTSAATAFYASVQVIAPSGRIMGNYISTAIAAGASADVTWFRMRNLPCPPPAPSPNPLGTLWAWWDFSDTTTLTVAAGKISQIADKTGGGHTLGQAVAAKQPGQSPLNGLNAGLFVSASDTCLVGGVWSPALSQPFTIALVSTQTIGATPSYLPGPYGGQGLIGPPPVLFTDPTGNTTHMQQGTNSILTGKATPYTQTQFTLIFDGASSHLRVNAIDTAGSVDVDALTDTAIGTQHEPTSPGTVSGIDGQIGEVLVYQGHLGAAQLSAVESYLKTKWATP